MLEDTQTLSFTDSSLTVKRKQLESMSERMYEDDR